MRELNENNIKTSSSADYYNLLIRAMQIFIGICFLVIIYLVLHTIIVEGKSLVVPTVSLGELGLFISIFAGVFLIRTFFNIAEYKSSRIKNLSEYQIIRNTVNKYYAERNRIVDELEALSTNTTYRSIGYFFASIIFLALAVFLFANIGQLKLDPQLPLTIFSFDANHLLYTILVASISCGYNILLIEFIKNFKIKNYILIVLFGLFVLCLSFYLAYPSFKVQLAYNISNYDFLNISCFASSLISGSFLHSSIQSKSEKYNWLKIELSILETKITECEEKLNIYSTEKKFQNK